MVEKLPSLDFPHGATLTVLRPVETYSRLGDKAETTTTHTISPCSIVDSHATMNRPDNGEGAWVGTVDVTAPPGADIQHNDRVRLPNGDMAIVVKPPERPVNPFTGWQPFTRFTLANAGYSPSTVGEW